MEESMRDRFMRDSGMNEFVPEWGTGQPWTDYLNARIERTERSFWHVSLERNERLYVDPYTGYQWVLD